MKQSTLKAIDNLKEDDLVALSYLYLFRAMDVEQLMDAVYHINTETPAGKRSRTIIVKRLLAQSVVTDSRYLPSREALQITNKGVDIVRYTRDIPNQVYDADIKAIKRGYYTAADLHLGDRFINHQVHLNQFMLDFTKKARQLGYAWKYYDEKFLSQFIGMRPDGLITMLDYDFFIEIDMATESKKQLLEKWQHYREFMQTDEFRYKPRKIVVLFDTDNLLSKKKINNRIDLVKKTIADTILDEVTGDFEIVAKPRDELIDYMFDSVAASVMNQNLERQQVTNYFNKLGYTLSYGWDLNKTLQGDFYNYYVRQLDDNRHVQVIGGFYNEFFLDFYDDMELSVLHRIDWYQKNTHLYHEKFGRDIKLIVAVSDIDKAVADFKLLGQRILGQPGIFLMKMDDIDQKAPLYENLYQVGIGGEVFKITSPELSRREFVYKIHDKEIKQKRGRLQKRSKR